MTDRIRYDESLPKEFVPIVKKLFDAELWLIPGWVQGLTVQFSDQSDHNICLCVSADYAYRWAFVTVYASFFTQSDETRRECVLHEFIHLSLEPLLQFVKQTFEETLKADAPKFHAVVEKQVIDRSEMAVQDLAYLIRQKTAGK